MALLMKCANGHEWDAAPEQEETPPPHLLACPVCGAQPDRSTAEELGEEPTFLQDELPPLPQSSVARPSRKPADPANKPLVPGYEILSELGRGGMGVVYLARQINLNRMVALKMLLAEPHAGDRELDRFRAEAETVASLHHPNIVHIYDIAMHDGFAYLALEYVEGGSLAQLLTGQPQSATVSAQIIRTLAQAIHAAHLRGIVHRDLKPANVLLQMADGSLPRGKPGQSALVLPSALGHLQSAIPKVTDFGLAKRLDSAGQSQSGVIMGTPTYMAPEQAEGKTKDIGPATDVYALGTILYEMLTGRPPFQGANSLDTIRAVASVEPVLPSKICAVPSDLEAICLRCLQKDPRRRYPTALALADELGGFLQEPLGDPKPGSRQPESKPARRKIALAFVSLLVVALGVFIWSWTPYWPEHFFNEPARFQVEELKKGDVIPPDKGGEKGPKAPVVEMLKKGNDTKPDEVKKFNPEIIPFRRPAEKIDQEEPEPMMESSKGALAPLEPGATILGSLTKNSPNCHVFLFSC